MGKNDSTVFVVTGAASGMGAATARRLGRRGKVLMVDIDAARLDQMAAQLQSEGIKVEKRVCNIMDEQSVRSLAAATPSLGHLSGIVNAAGISPAMADWRRILAVDYVGTALLLREFLPLAEPGTAAVCIASIASRLLKSDPVLEAVLDDPLAADFLSRIEPFLAMPLPSSEVDPRGGAAYVLAKRGVVRLCERLAPAWALRGARLVSISPGNIDTPMGRLEMERMAYMRETVEQTPMRRLGKPEEIAAAADFLCSDDASFITGCDLLVDGGYIAAMTHAAIC